MLWISLPSVEPSLVVDTLSDFERLTKVIELADGRPWDYGWRDLQDMAR